jgi:hypothetical protein
MLDVHLTAPLEFLGPRFINPDAAGLVLQRLDQHALVELEQWFRGSPVVRGGHGVARHMPVLDAWLEAIEPPIPPDVEGHGCAIGALGIAAGLVAGACAIEAMSEEPLFPATFDLHFALEVVGGLELRSQVLAATPSDVAAARLQAVFGALFLLAPGLLLVNRALFHAGLRASDVTPGASGRRVWPRLHFCAGMVAAGLTIPSAHSPELERLLRESAALPWHPRPFDEDSAPRR